jgi:haloacetate dehalogenase
MAVLGHERFAVAGHDRGGRVAYRMALDHPDRVSAAAVLDVVPTGEVWSRADARLALLYWYWSFLAQPAPLPERLIAADPDAFFDLHVRALGLGGEPDRYPADLMAAYRRLLDDPSTVAAICEDYRAGASLDRDHDDADLGTRRIECPLLALWSERGALPRLYGDVLEVWRPLCSEDARSYGLLQLSDKAGGAAFTEEDADNILELAAFAGATLDALRAACGRSAAPAG